ncbi:MAG: glycosyltransferase family 2 protein [Acidobacteriaceae bacterium]
MASPDWNGGYYFGIGCYCRMNDRRQGTSARLLAESSLISIVIPVYNEVEVIPSTYARLTEVMVSTGHPYELVFVNDGSIDLTQSLLDDLCDADLHVGVMSFTRNFGHQAAITAGVEVAQGDAIVIIDGDLQDPPELIPDMIAAWQAGAEVVYGQRLDRDGETWMKKGTARLFYRLLSHSAPFDIPVDTGDFRLISRRVATILNRLPERNRFMRGLVAWTGFRSVALTYRRDARYEGTTKYSMRKMLELAVSGLVGFSSWPLRLVGLFGMIVAAAGFLYALYVVIVHIFTHQTVPGWSSLMASVLVLGGVQLLVMGMLGEYVSKIFEETRQRPIYVPDRYRGATIRHHVHRGSGVRDSESSPPD